MVSPISFLRRFAIGNALGVIAFVALGVATGEGRVSSCLWVAKMWTPLSVFYCAVILGVSRRLIRLQSVYLISFLGFVVALLPFASGGWPLYWWLPQITAMLVGIHLLLLAAAASAWLFLVRFFTPTI